MKPDDKTSNRPVDVECTIVPNDHTIATDDIAGFEDITTSPIKRAKEKADRKKKERKKKKKKDECSLEMKLCEQIEYPLPFRHDFLSLSETSLLSRSKMVSKQIRCAEGRVIPECYRLKLDEDSGIFFGLTDNDGYYIGKSSKMDGHICVIGESGRGKTESIVKPTILTYQNGSTIIFDFKDNLHSHWISTARALGKNLSTNILLPTICVPHLRSTPDIKNRKSTASQIFAWTTPIPILSLLFVK